MKKTPPKGPGVSKGKKAKPKKPTTAKHAGGRPTKYRAEFEEQAYKLCLLGATDQEMADFFRVSEATINAWKLGHAKFLESITRGKMMADAEMAHSLYHRGLGYSHLAVKIIAVSLGQNMGSEVQQVPYTEHYPPDTPAASLWLRNRQPAKWRDKVEHTGGSKPEDQPIPFALVDPAAALALLEQKIAGGAR